MQKGCPGTRSPGTLALSEQKIQFLVHEGAEILGCVLWKAAGPKRANRVCMCVCVRLCVCVHKISETHPVLRRNPRQPKVAQATFLSHLHLPNLRVLQTSLPFQGVLSSSLFVSCHNKCHVNLNRDCSKVSPWSPCFGNLAAFPVGSLLVVKTPCLTPGKAVEPNDGATSAHPMPVALSHTVLC